MTFTLGFAIGTILGGAIGFGLMWLLHMTDKDTEYDHG